VKDTMRNIEQTIPTTLIQFADLVMVAKLSGYNHSAWGHGRQHDGPKRLEQNLPFTTVYPRQFEYEKREKGTI
jgi:hypothetical protein